MTKKSLLNKTEYHVKSYADLGGCFRSTDNVLLELHNGLYHSIVSVKYSTALALVMRFQLANETRDMRTFCFISQGLPIPLGIHCMDTSLKWCSVHAVSTRCATVYIVIPFLPVRRHFLKACALQRFQSLGWPQN